MEEIVELDVTSTIIPENQSQSSGVSFLGEGHDVDDDDMYYTDHEGKQEEEEEKDEEFDIEERVKAFIEKINKSRRKLDHFPKEESGREEDDDDDDGKGENIQYHSLEEIFESIRSKFNILSTTLIRKCFLFWHLYPKNYEFYMDDIIHLWIAQGFVQSPLAELKKKEDTACLWYKEFERFRVIEPSCLDSSTGRLRYKLNHYFVDLLKARPHYHFRLDNGNNAYISESILHASLSDSIDPITFKDLYRAKELLTLLILHEKGSRLEKIPHNLFLKLPLLRALDLSQTSITELPSSIGNLDDLRYLNLSGTPITILPDSICSLYQMQTLKLRGCSKLLRLPKGVTKLINLRHLDVEASCLLASMPPGFRNNAQLQTLPAFFVGKENGCHITELKNMVNLQGTFRISRLENVSSVHEAKEAALDQKKYLDKLELHWTEEKDGFELLENLQPHTQVQELQIVGYAGAKFPSWIGNPIFSSLTTVTIHDCRNCKLLPPLGKLPSLETLRISAMSAVKTIDSQFCGRDTVERVRDTVVAFRTLENLILKNMPSLEEWGGIKEPDFSSLQNLNISHCPKLTALPKLSLLKHLKKLEISFCPLLKFLPTKGLPISLQYLVIINCPLLKKLHHKGKGQDWWKLVLVPNVWIDYQLISQAHPTPTTGIAPLSSQGLKSTTIPVLSTSTVKKDKDASVEFMSHYFKKKTNEGEKNNKATATPSNPRSSLPNIIRKYLWHKGKNTRLPNNVGREMYFSLKSFSFAELEKATGYFHPDNVLGEGGFGKMYIGRIDENTLTDTKRGTSVIAVKRLEQEGSQGQRELVTELNYLGKLYHPNLVRLVGFCIDEKHQLLAYEFMPRGSLDNYIFNSGEILSWSLRMKIALGAAKGLAFLHSAETNVIHRCFHTSKILLDLNYNAKLSGFGCARDMDGPNGDETQIVGVLGYIAPEYALKGLLTASCDVYSFGVVLLEMLSGRRAVDMKRRYEEVNLVEWAKPCLIHEQKIFHILDSRLNGSYPLKDVRDAGNLAFLCLSKQAKFRPHMDDVVKALEELQEDFSTEGPKESK